MSEEKDINERLLDILYERSLDNWVELSDLARWLGVSHVEVQAIVRNMASRNMVHYSTYMDRPVCSITQSQWDRMVPKADD